MGAPWAQWDVAHRRFAPVAAYMKRTIADVRRKCRQLLAVHLQQQHGSTAGGDGHAGAEWEQE